MQSNEGSRQGSNLNRFCDAIDSRGAGDAPNGASYRVVPSGRDYSAVERTYRGQRETIVGYNGDLFSNIYAARSWAKMDGRYAMDPGKTIPERDVVA